MNVNCIINNKYIPLISGVCTLLSQIMDTTCFETSLLEFWPAEFDFSKPMTLQDVIDRVNKPNAVSSTFQAPINIERYLGGKITRENGKVVSAEATVLNWFGKISFDVIDKDAISQQGETIDKFSMEFEKDLETMLLGQQESLPDNVKSFVNVARGFSDVSGATIKGDVMMMPIGYFIVFIYVTIMLGKFSCTEQRGLLALGGLGCIGLTIGFTYGFCSALGLFYSPMHSIIPFLLLGIGIDDMFVIMQCYDNLGGERTDDIVNNIALTMKHAGVAITVTSLTDFIVFALGGTTVLPALRSFCLWCSVGIFIVYFFSATIFTALLSLDCKRIATGRNGLCPCYVHSIDSLEDSLEDKLSLSQKAFQFLSKLILSIPGSIVIFVVTATLFAIGIWGITELKQEFNPVWFLPPTSQIYSYFTINKEYFPSSGASVSVYITDINWDKDFDKIEYLIADLEKEKDIIAKQSNWFDDIKRANTTTCQSYNNNFKTLLTCFLFSTTKGFISHKDFYYKNKAELKCGEPAPDILLGKITFTHKRLESSTEHIPALEKVKEIMKKANDRLTSGGKIFSMSQVYSTWETNSVITQELIRNLALAIVCVFITTLILLADFLASLYVLLCVGLTLVNLCGYMHFWGLTIEIVSSVNVIIAIGK